MALMMHHMHEMMMFLNDSMQELSNSTGNILDNEELLTTLEGAKSKASEISQKLVLARETAKEIEQVDSLKFLVSYDKLMLHFDAKNFNSSMFYAATTPLFSCS